MTSTVQAITHRDHVVGNSVVGNSVVGNGNATDCANHDSDHGPSQWVGLKRALPAAGLAGVCAAAAFTELSADEGTVWCPYRVVTGGWCPGCGCTRALKALVRGNVGDSLAMNPWTAILFVQALVFSIAFLIVPARVLAWAKQHQLAIGGLNIVVALSFWALRLATGVIPLPFS